MKLQSLRLSLGRPLTLTERRLAALAVTAPLALWLGFIGLTVKQAEHIVRNQAYFVMLLAFALFSFALFRTRSAWFAGGPPVVRREKWLATALILGFSWVAFNAEPMRAKVLNDEFVLQSTAYNLHHFRDAGAMVRGYEIAGVFLPLGEYLDKRPIFYPFLVSLVHDLTGFRIHNAFAVNALLLPVIFWLTWWLARRLAGPPAGLLAVALLGTLPLLSQGATGSGMELTNAAMILLSTALAVHYLEQPGAARLSAFVLALVLLCQSRYESAVFVVAGAMVVLLAWWRERRVVLSWVAVLAPLLLVPFALQHKVLANSPVLWELPVERTARFGLENVPENLRRAVNYFTSRDINQSSSWYLSLAGAIGFIWLLVQLWRFRRTRLPDWNPAALAASPFALAILGNLALVMTYFWAGLDDPMASRFALPFCLLLTVLGAVALARIGLRGWSVRLALVGALVFTLAVSMPRLTRHAYSNLGIKELEWMVREVQAREPGPRIVIANRSTLIWLLHRTPSILINRALLYQDRLQFQLTAGFFQEILITQELRPASAMGDHQVVPEDVVPKNFQLETLVERRFGTKLVRISRLVAIKTGTAQES
jgi:hypothetical protein